MDVEPEREEVTDLSSPDVQTKYRDAATIANAVLTGLIGKLAAGRAIADLCDEGDRAIEEACAKVYKSKKVEKGIAFPTCISVNELVGHFSPLKSESPVLAAGDLVKIDLGVHIDGYCALVAHTVVLAAEGSAAVSGPKADVIAAAHQAAEVALRLIKPGAKNTEVTSAIEKVAEAYGVKAFSGVQATQLERFNLEGKKSIPLRRDPEVKYEEVEFAANEVYAVDIALSTGEGKPKATPLRTTVFRRQVDLTYSLKLKSARALVNEVEKRFPILPFTLRAIGEDAATRMGVTEASKHGVLAAYPVLAEKEGVATAHFRFTVLLLPGGTLKVTGLDMPAVATEKKLPADLEAVRATVPFVKKAKGSGPPAPAEGGAAKGGGM